MKTFKEQDSLVETVKNVMEGKQMEGKQKSKSNQYKKDIDTFYKKINQVAEYFEDPTFVFEKIYDFLEKIIPSNSKINKIDKKNAFYEKINQVARYFENPTHLFDALYGYLKKLTDFLKKIKRMKDSMKPNISSIDIEKQKKEERTLTQAREHLIKKIFNHFIIENQVITEYMDNPSPFKETSKQVYQFKVKGNTYTAKIKNGVFDFRDKSGNKTTSGIGYTGAIQVFATVYAILVDMIEKGNVRSFSFWADKLDDQTWISLSWMMARKISKELPYRLRVKESEKMDVFHFTRI